MTKLPIAFGLTLCILLSGCLLPQSPSPSLPPPPENWNQWQLKLTYICPQEKLVPTIGISVQDFNRTFFEGSVRTGIDYSNDDLALRVIRVEKGEMEHVVYAVSALDFIRQPGPHREPFTSLMLYNATSGILSEVFLDSDQTTLVARTIRNSLSASRANAEALRIYS